MFDWRHLSTHYTCMTWRQRPGNLASTLAHFATASQNPRTTTDLLREGMWIIDWSADAPINVLAELAPMQLELGLLERSWQQDAQAVQPVLALCARAMSERVLELSELLSE